VHKPAKTHRSSLLCCHLIFLLLLLLIIYCECLFCFLSLGGRLRFFTPVYISTLANSVPPYITFLCILLRLLISRRLWNIYFLATQKLHQSSAEESRPGSKIRVMGYELLLQWHDQAATC
jgi:hypothetical protein